MGASGVGTLINVCWSATACILSPTESLPSSCFGLSALNMTDRKPYSWLLLLLALMGPLVSTADSTAVQVSRNVRPIDAT